MFEHRGQHSLVCVPAICPVAHLMESSHWMPTQSPEFLAVMPSWGINTPGGRFLDGFWALTGSGLGAALSNPVPVGSFTNNGLSTLFLGWSAGSSGSSGKGGATTDHKVSSSYDAGPYYVRLNPAGKLGLGTSIQDTFQMQPTWLKTIRLTNAYPI